MTDLTKRLRRMKSVADYYGNAGATPVNPDGPEAANELARLLLDDRKKLEKETKE